MRKLILAIAILGMSIAAQAQTERVTLKEMKIRSIEITNVERITDGKHELYYVGITYQNQKYKHITSIGALMFMNNKQLDKFYNELEMAVTSCREGRDVSYTYFETMNGYSQILIIDRNNKYTSISPEEGEQILEFLTGIELQ